ncbi:MAG: sulfotransferase domain-containing protein [bacterium]|nr:sulfotransferase domain-containing protein [bacterium]
MFYFIGGAPRTGKTILSKRLSKELGVPWISVDTLESVIMRYVSGDSFDAIFPKTAIRKITRGSNDVMYTQYSTTDIVEAYKKQARTTWEAIKVFIECEAMYDHSYIIEGHQIHPELLNSFADIDMKVIFLGRENVKDTIYSATQFAGKHDWFTEKTQNKETYEKMAEMLVRYSKYFKQEAEKYGFEYSSVDGNFKEIHDRAFEGMAR